MTEETTQPNSLGTEAVTSETPNTGLPEGSAPATEKPAWLPDDKYFDATSGVKYDDLSREFKELSEFKAKADAEAAARKAEMPEKAADYGYAPEDYELPAGYQVVPESPMWKVMQEEALARGYTKAEYAELAKKFITASNEQQAMSFKNLANVREEGMKVLGDDYSAQITAVKDWFKSSADAETAAELGETLWTPRVVRHMQKLQKALTSQGAAGFNGLGRDGAGGGDDADFAKLSFVEKWHRSSKTDRRAS